MSMAPSGASTRSILARIAVTAPVSSSTLSPRTRSAMRKPPMFAGVTSPDSIASKASAASTRVSVAPAATLARKGFNDSIRNPSRRRAPVFVPRRCQTQEIPDHQVTVLGGDAFGVKLHAVHGMGGVREAHDQPVIGFRGDFERLPGPGGLDHQRMVARRQERAVDAAEDRAAL